MKYQDGENIMNIVIKLYLAQKKNTVGNWDRTHERLIRSSTS